MVLRARTSGSNSSIGWVEVLTAVLLLCLLFISILNVPLQVSWLG